MSAQKKLLCALASVLLSTLWICPSLKAQLEVAHLSSKGTSANGFGAFLHVGIPVSQGGEVTGEAAFYTFTDHEKHLGMAPFFVGYRHTFDGSGAGWYTEPAAGYTIGATDIQKTDANGNLLYDNSGKEIDQKLSGPIAGLTLGYIIPSATIPINFGLRYQHLFVTGGDPAQNMYSLRISWSLSAGRKMGSASAK